MVLFLVTILTKKDAFRAINIYLALCWGRKRTGDITNVMAKFKRMDKKYFLLLLSGRKNIPSNNEMTVAKRFDMSFSF